MASAVERGVDAGALEEQELDVNAVGQLIRYALETDSSIFDSTDLLGAPVALFYDLDAWEAQLSACLDAFGPTFEHAIACKSNPLQQMLQLAKEKTFGVECASMSEVLHATEAVGVEPRRVVFDSPAKTRAELEYAIKAGIHINIDNYEELGRATEIVDGLGGSAPGVIGLRVNPRVGAGTIAALSVSTAESKFGFDVGEPEARRALLDAYAARPWLTSVHVHVGSGGMGLDQLVGGVRAAVDFANDVTTGAVTSVDIGGGLPVDYARDLKPDFAGYAGRLREAVPELFDGTYSVVTEFGASLNAKSGVFVSRIEWIKQQPKRKLAIVHFGADCALRQAYTNDHPRRWAAYRSDGTPFPRDADAEPVSVGGPLCFQGDVLIDARLPKALEDGDFLAMRDAGANHLSLFSRHCSRLAPPVYGFRWNDPVKRETPATLVLLKPRERRADVSAFWGAPR